MKTVSLCAFAQERALTGGFVLCGQKAAAVYEQSFFNPPAHAAGSPGLLCVNKNSSYCSMQEVVDALNAAPGSVSIAGTTGGLWFVLAKLFDSYGDVPFKWVPYRTRCWSR